MSDLEDYNEEYLEDTEQNAKLFEEKMKKLRSYMNESSNNYKKSENNEEPPTAKRYESPEHNEEEHDSHLDYIKNKYNIKSKEESNDYDDIPIKGGIKNNIKSNYSKRNNFNDNIPVLVKAPKKKKEKVEPQSNNQKYLEQINDLKKEITQLKNDLDYKNRTIEDYKNQLKEIKRGPSKEEYNELNKDLKCLVDELEQKNEILKKNENEIKGYRNKIENLINVNKNMREEGNKDHDEIENLKLKISELREQISIEKSKFQNLEEAHRKLTRDYEILNLDFQKIKKDLINNQSILEEKNNEIYNFKKELSSLTNSNLRYTISNFHSKDLNNIQSSPQIRTNYYKNQSEESKPPENKVTKEKNIEQEKIQKIEDEYENIMRETKNKKEKQRYVYNKDETDFFPSNKKIDQRQISQLENDLSYFLNQKSIYENDLLKLPEKVRTLNDTKKKKELNDKINHVNMEISHIKNNLKNIRGY